MVIAALVRVAAGVMLLGLVVACGSDRENVSCNVSVGDENTVVTFEDAVGESSVATVGAYTVTFTVHERHQLSAEVRDADSTLMTGTSGGVIGAGSVGTPDGRLDYSCGV